MSGTDPTPATPAAPAAPAANPAPAAPVPSLLGGAVDPASPNTPADPAVTPPAPEQPKPPEPAKPIVPEKYEFKAPDGVTLDAIQIEAATPVFKELGLSQEQADKLVGLQTDFMKAHAEAQQTSWLKTVETWGADTKADKEIGGTDFAANIGLAAKALDKFGTPALRTALDTYGLGNHPEVVRAFVRIGKAMGEDKLVTGATGAAGDRSLAERIFPHLPPR